MKRIDDGSPDLVGKRFRRLLVLSGLRLGRELMLVCRCDCGKEKTATRYGITCGDTKSCGCLKRENSSLRTHGLRRHPLYAMWLSMNQRCNNKKHKNYATYGGAGVKVCDRWRGKDGFPNFIADMGERPLGMQLDRYPKRDGDYEPGNCRWATPRQNCRNRKSNRPITHNGKTMLLIEWAEELGIHDTTLICRLKAGWSVAEALTSRRGRRATQNS